MSAQQRVKVASLSPPATPTASPAPASNTRASKTGSAEKKERVRPTTRASSSSQTSPTVEQQRTASTTSPTIEEQQCSTSSPASAIRALSFHGQLAVMSSGEHLRGAYRRVKALLAIYDAEVEKKAFLNENETLCAAELRKVVDLLEVAMEPTMRLPVDSNNIFVLGTIGQLRLLESLPGSETRGLFATAYEGKVGASGLILYCTTQALRVQVVYNVDDEDDVEVLPSQRNDALLRSCCLAHSPPLEETFEKLLFFEFPPDMIKKSCALRFQDASTGAVLVSAAVMVRDRAPSGRRMIAPHAPSPKGRNAYSFVARSPDVGDDGLEDGVGHEQQPQQPESCTVQ
jgi:hypothetical protein